MTRKTDAEYSADRLALHFEAGYAAGKFAAGRPRRRAASETMTQQAKHGQNCGNTVLSSDPPQVGQFVCVCGLDDTNRKQAIVDARARVVEAAQMWAHAVAELERLEGEAQPITITFNADTGKPYDYEVKP